MLFFLDKWINFTQLQHYLVFLACRLNIMVSYDNMHSSGMPVANDDDFTVDDMFESRISRKESQGKIETRNRQRAVLGMVWYGWCISTITTTNYCSFV